VPSGVLVAIPSLRPVVHLVSFFFEIRRFSGLKRLVKGLSFLFIFRLVGLQRGENQVDI